VASRVIPELHLVTNIDPSRMMNKRKMSL